MKVTFLALVSAVFGAPVENQVSLDKRAWMTGIKSFNNGEAIYSNRMALAFKIALNAGKQYKYRLRFIQLQGYQNSFQEVLTALPDSNGIVRFYNTDASEIWNAVGRTFTLDRTIPGSGVWQDEKALTADCPAGSTTQNSFTYLGVFTFVCSNK